MSTARRRRATVLALVVALLVVPVAGGQLGGLAQEQVDPDTVVLQVELRADGDASWAVHYRTRLDDDNTTAAFESLQADVSADPTAYTADFGDRMNRTIATAENATGREMALRNLTVATETEALPQEYGVVTYRFEWTNFAAVEGDQLRAGDALSGLYLDEESTLRIDWPAGYERTSVDPSPTRSDEQMVAWDGRLDFESDEPRLVVSESTTAGETTTGAGDGGGDAWLLVVATLLAAGGVVALLWANRRYGIAGGAAADDGSETPDGATGEATAEDAGDDPSPPPELLSNEERVLQLLDDSGGRLKQRAIAERLDWTAAKTSQVIGDLREEDELETFRIGRENVVTLPGVDLASDVGEDDES
ncbi:hypothetical protein IL252_07805 [Halomicrobium sp. IBSBa]|uniref:helix-turn-helix transcriptional regulator n=1 Tax=Halomicrobium sp. IBSBa TaxID=2778916 RepID=UPI001ABFC84C|nr:hypothetical protein [Halomicrobium sp. IBSBa]MBO4247717.1 hypothetical protein [Halomicrobium sp. IBSBa]